ncbi:MAG TPA: pyridoxal phosphate-dependent aminotransferase [Ramlibacter sp.]|jgi:aspartate/methionine/tyrosine aminotransferase|uniref:pyridoxal phosphate-dependent aminotransferase n=1 Tax=Ramlibacter sp. TaxID=1917967 RepID=UPI002D59C45A|nr:pyridoxal phosphate-dependent aminotransferase [Ramlibacter sp.]HZY19582.1 pyridoxal phosphate-dependent aminotransferase [Ramlibacter sp.]
MRQTILDLEESKIREVANAGMGRSDVLAFWFGESDEVTPDIVRQAAIDSLQRGETFYAHNLGLPELREAVAGYTSRLHRPVGAQRIAITSGGVNALMLAVQALVDAGDDVVAVTPVWPNLTAQPLILGARLRRVSLTPRDGAWTLDLPRLLEAVTPATKLLIVNAPNNPTGWTLSRAEQQAILAHCRRTGTWILADEVYERLYYADDGACAPSFLDVAQPEDRLVVAHSFSKSFLMTGWRLGWLVMPESMTHAMGKLIEFNTSCASVFTQRAALAALQHTDAITPRVVAHLKACRDRLVPQLQALPGVELAMPQGGMYAFFRLLAGEDDSLRLAKRLVAEAGLGIAPGNAFAPEAQGWLRWCFASKDLARLDRGVERLAGWLQARR